MGNKLYVGNLSYNVRDDDLQQAFAQYGTVSSAKVMMDRDTGRSKGFGFVEMGSDPEAQAAINGMNGQALDGRAIVVNEARPREERPGGFGGGGGSRGGYGGDRVTTLNLKVVQTDVERGLVLVEGAVPGAKGGWITLRDAVKKKLPKDAPKPGKFRLPDAEASTGNAEAAPAEAAPANQEGA